MFAHNRADRVYANVREIAARIVYYVQSDSIPNFPTFLSPRIYEVHFSLIVDERS